MAPDKLVLLLVDETRTADQDAIIAAWAKAIAKAEPEVRIFNDPIWPDPRDATPAMYEASHFLCPNRVRWLEQPEAYEAVFPPQRDAGRTLMLYSCSGPVRRLDPYGYHLLQVWECFRVGAVASMFWSFGDSGGGTAWNEYVTPGHVYCPQMLGPEGAEDAKHLEAIREGRQDYEYLVMLQAAVAAATAAGRRDPVVEQSRALLSAAPRRVLGEPDPATIQWQRDADRGASERVRRGTAGRAGAVGPLSRAPCPVATGVAGWPRPGCVSCRLPAHLETDKLPPAQARQAGRLLSSGRTDEEALAMTLEAALQRVREARETDLLTWYNDQGEPQLSAAENLELWLTNPVFAEHVEPALPWIEAGDWPLLIDSFKQVIPLGTAGTPRRLAPGPNRMNARTVAESAAGLAAYYGVDRRAGQRRLRPRP
ncbi:MAG: hypothetical protein M5U09_23060 [Gammaproteobacteria bacterium]|nr:hypothetical protein [Gammaproteobacteria bacterium]